MAQKIKRSRLDQLAQEFWSGWANGDSGFGPHLEAFAQAVVKDLGGEVEEDTRILDDTAVAD